MVGSNFNNRASGKELLELRLVNFEGSASPVLVSGCWFDDFSLSEDGGFLAFLVFQDERGLWLTLITLPNGSSTPVYQAETPGSLSWLGWAP